MNALQLAALIAAGSFAVLVCVAVFVLLRLARLLAAVTVTVGQYQERADRLIEQAQAAVDRANEQLLRTDVITASLDQVTTNMAELSGHVSALAGLARGVSGAVSAPFTGMSAFLYGLRRAIVIRRALQAATVQGRAAEPVTAPVPRAAITGVVASRTSRSRAGQR